MPYYFEAGSLEAPVDRWNTSSKSRHVWPAPPRRAVVPEGQKRVARCESPRPPRSRAAVHTRPGPNRACKLHRSGGAAFRPRLHQAVCWDLLSQACEHRLMRRRARASRVPTRARANAAVVRTSTVSHNNTRPPMTMTGLDQRPNSLGCNPSATGPATEPIEIQAGTVAQSRGCSKWDSSVHDAFQKRTPRAFGSITISFLPHLLPCGSCARAALAGAKPGLIRSAWSHA
jgi:hypothetical protein